MVVDWGEDGSMVAASKEVEGRRGEVREREDLARVEGRKREKRRCLGEEEDEERCTPPVRWAVCWRKELEEGWGERRRESIGMECFWKKKRLLRRDVW